MSAPDPRRVAAPHAGLGHPDPDAVGPDDAPFDPLRLCVYATVALLGWVLGPLALLGFSVLAIAGYARARRQGLLRSRCKLGDTRVVLAYLIALAVAACGGIGTTLYLWTR